jgi:hypothetical protein
MFRFEKKKMGETRNFFFFFKFFCWAWGKEKFCLTRAKREKTFKAFDF